MVANVVEDVILTVTPDQRVLDLDYTVWYWQQHYGTIRPVTSPTTYALYIFASAEQATTMLEMFCTANPGPMEQLEIEIVQKSLAELVKEEEITLFSTLILTAPNEEGAKEV